MWLLYTEIAVIFIVAMAYAGYKLAQVDLRRSGFIPRSKKEAPVMDKDTERLALEESRTIEDLLGDFRRSTEAGFDDIRRCMERIEQSVTRMEAAMRSADRSSRAMRRSTEQTDRRGTSRLESPNGTADRARP